MHAPNGVGELVSCPIHAIIKDLGALQTTKWIHPQFRQSNVLAGADKPWVANPCAAFGRGMNIPTRLTLGSSPLQLSTKGDSYQDASSLA